MIDQASELISQKNIHSHQNQGILLATFPTSAMGFSFVRELLYKILEKTTVLYLSGGRTPKQLYTELADDELLNPGAFALIDERYGPPMHPDSNEKMLRDTGLTQYAKFVAIPFYGILKDSVSREETADLYDQEVRRLFATYPKHVGILGIGLDGHTAGLPANPALWEAGVTEHSKTNMVTEYNDAEGFYKERVTMTFNGLSMLDFLIVLVFGEDKRKALELTFSEGKEEEIPARFFKRPEIATKTIFITDQTV